MITNRLLELVKRFEGLRLKAYQDQGGTWTAGYGSTGPDIGPDTVWTLQEAENRLEGALERFQQGVIDLVTVPITENQRDALVSFAYNVGLGALEHSTLLRELNSGQSDAAAQQFQRWSKVGGIENPGLLKRRLAEKALFQTA